MLRRLFLNYTNPMAMLTLAMLKSSPIRTVGICHSVQVCVPQLLFPEYEFNPEKHDDLVRFEIMKQFGYYVTESSEHNAEFMPYFIKKNHPELIEKYQIPLDEYPRRCRVQIEHWNRLRDSLVNDVDLSHKRTHEYPSYILEALETGKSFTFAGNVMNDSLIPNLPGDCCVEVTCVADQGRIQPCHVGPLPRQLAALNRPNIGMQQLTVDAALSGKRDLIYQAALLDPHTAAELTIDETRAMVDDLIEAHGDWFPKYY